MKPNEIRDIHHCLSQGWGLEVPPNETRDWDALVEALASRVDYLLAHDYERLLHGMYLLDVSEARFNEAMDPAGAEVPPRAIAQLILKREMEKMESRRRYAKSDPSTENVRLDDQPRVELEDKDR